MTVKVCTSEYLLSTVDGLGMARNWFPRIVAERFLGSTKDGPITRAPDPVTMIDGDITWHNNTRDPQMLAVQIIRAPRTIVAQNPSTVVIQDAHSHATGVSPVADYPSIVQDGFGGRAQVDRPETRPEDIRFGRLFTDADSSQTWVNIGQLDPRHSLHFRYLAAVHTPGTWTAPSEYEPRWEAHARWTRLLVFAGPIGAT